MKVLVGTMESGESDFAACCAAIASQHHPHTHVVISNLPEPEAHAALYEKWEAAKSEFDLFLKVDADTILAHQGVITDIVELFQKNPRLTGIQAWLYDHITDQKIYGLGCISSKVSLIQPTSKLHPDRVDTAHDIVIRGDDLPQSLNPAGEHCRTVTDEQAFHYGLHRRLKGQQHVINRVKQVYYTTRDRTRAFVLIGAHMAGSFVGGASYADDAFKEAYARAVRDYLSLLGDI